ncbi:uncharacterized protein PG998_004203 [Apiospora kogelbergensis]|uniref:DUF7888 domain-containing protein n=1 Tax=Apiospora kogelbergensis TaxID=1337665 RepID=A0AAW0QH22_9PEZI
MRFTATNALALLSATVTLTSATPTGHYSPNAAVAIAEERSVVQTLDRRAPVEKREILLAILTAVGTTAATAITTKAVEAAAGLIKNLANFDNAREAFTKKTADAMWAANPDPKKYAAAVCYNMSYDLQDPKGMDGLISAKMTLGPLHTDYDCFYMTANNALYTRGDGGFINLAFVSDKRCTFDRDTADLTCTA